MAYNSEKWLYEKNSNDTARYILGEPGDKPLVCVGINPSTAVPNDLDRTLMNVKQFSKINGYDGWLMLNIYPQRTPHPNELHQELDDELHSLNLNYIAKYLSKYNEVDVWAAWGNSIGKRKYLCDALRDIVKGLEGVKVRWVNIGKVTKKGHPHHPLRLPHKSKVEKFDIDAYLRGL